MGLTFSSLFSSLAFWSRSKELRILILGLDSAGKTTILYRLQLGDVVVETTPTLGFNMETLQYKNIKLQMWDLGGQTSIRPYWRCYYADTAAIIFVIDSSDLERLHTCKTELLSMLSEEELSTSKLLILANKQDLPNAASVAEISDRLGLANGLKDRSWSIQPCSAIKGQGLEEGMDWLVNAIQQP